MAFDGAVDESMPERGNRMNVERAVQAFRRNGFDVSYFETALAAIAHLEGKIQGMTVGFGDSSTLLVLDLYRRLSPANTVHDPQHGEPDVDFLETARRCLTAQVFLTSVNALSETGEMVSLDGTGNRVAGSTFGHEKVYLVAGVNKLVPTLPDAIWRVRNVAAPRNAQRLGLKTPCALRGDRCHDCRSPDRICNAMLIFLHKVNDMDVELVLINESLGY